MYSTCIHCQSALGENALIETLPIGRRIAFDAGTGRLWVVCPKCARWNLVPFESRWESIEAGEKLYRDSTQRMSTGEIGLAKTREGTELVRIGEPLRPEMAAWRYGSLLSRRRLRYAATTLPIGVALGLMSQAPLLYLQSFRVEIASYLSLNMVALFGLQSLVNTVNHRYVAGKTQSTLALGEQTAYVTRAMAANIIVQPTEENGVTVWVPMVRRPVESYHPLHRLMMLPTFLRERLGGDRGGVWKARFDAATHYTQVDAEDQPRALRQILPVMHEQGAGTRMIEEATTHLSARGVTASRLLFSGRDTWEKTERARLCNVSKPRRLALEMLVHEDSERRWLAGELLDLEHEWRKADAIAEIADGLLRDPAVEAELTRLKSEWAGDAERQR